MFILNEPKPAVFVSQIIYEYGYMNRFDCDKPAVNVSMAQYSYNSLFGHYASSARFGEFSGVYSQKSPRRIASPTAS